MATWRKYSDYTESVDNVRTAISEAYTNFEILRAQADMQGKGSLFLNGDCAIDQPNAGAAIAAGASTFARDGLVIAKTGGGGFTTQKTTNANLLTARNPVITCDRYTVTTAAASPAAGDYYVGNMNVEGFRASRLQYGRASARRAWLCATARSSVAWTLSGSLRNNAADRSFVWSVPLAANTTQDIAIDVSGCVDGTWLADHQPGLRAYLNLGSGSTLGGTANIWQSSNKVGVAGAGLMATLSATLDITAFELVIGDTAPGLYIPPDPQAELARCMREWEQGHFEVQHTNNVASQGHIFSHPWKVLKRVDPAGSLGSTSISGYASVTVRQSLTRMFSVNLNTATTGTANYCAGYFFGDARLS